MYYCVSLTAFSFASSKDWKVASFLPLQQDPPKVCSPKTTISTLCNATFHPMDGAVDWTNYLIM